MASDPTFSVRVALSNNQKIEKSVLSKLLGAQGSVLIDEIKRGEDWTFSQFDFRWKVIRFTNKWIDDIEAQKFFINCHKDEVLEALGSNLLADPEVLEKIYRKGTKQTQEAILKNPNCPEVLSSKINQKSSWGKQLVAASNPMITERTAKRLLKSNKESVLAVLGRNSSTPSRVMEVLKHSSVVEVQKAVALNENLKAEDFLFFEKIDSSGVKEALALNPQTPLEVLERLANSKNNFSTYCALSKHPNASEELVIRLLKGSLFASYRRVFRALDWVKLVLLERNFSQEYFLVIEDTIKEVSEELRSEAQWVLRGLFLKTHKLDILKLGPGALLMFLYLFFDFNIPIDFIAFLTEASDFNVL